MLVLQENRALPEGMHKETPQTSAQYRAEPAIQGQEIHLHDDDGETSDSSSTSSHGEDEESDREKIAVFLDTITSENSVDNMSMYYGSYLKTVV